MTNEELLGALLQSQLKTDAQLRDTNTQLRDYMTASDERAKRMDERLDRFITASEASMKHMESLTATLTETVVHMDTVITELVRAITTGRANGKTEH